MKNVLHGAQNLRQRFRVELRRSTRAGRKTRQSNLPAAWLDWVHAKYYNRLPRLESHVKMRSCKVKE